MTNQSGFNPAQTGAIVLLVAVGLVLLALAVLGLRNRTIAKLGLRNIPRRRSQSALIVLGLTLSTIIIVSALSIGDTLSYSVRRHAINAYGTIDQVISPPLLSALAGLVTSAEDGGNPTDALAGSELSGVLNGDLLSILGLLQKGLPGISEERYAQLRDQAQADPATAAVVDGLAPSIAFPTIIRDRTSGQGVPLGFIVAVNNEYDEQFGLTTVDGRPVQMESLRTGVGNIFAEANKLFRWADSIGINVNSVAAFVAQAGALITQGQEQVGDPTQPMTGTLDLAALGGALSAGNLDLAAAGAALGLDTNALLSAVNLNTLGTEIDRVLEQVGLELRQGDVYLNRLGAEQLNAQPGDVLDIFIGPLPVPFRVRAVVEQAGPLGALKPVVMLRLDEAQELLFMPGRINNVLVSNAGDADTGMANTAAAARQLRALALNEAALTELVALLREPDVLAAIAAGANGSAPRASTRSSDGEDMADFLAFLGGGMGNVALAERTPSLVEELGRTGISQELRVLLAQPDMQNWLRRLPLPAETGDKLGEILGRISDLEVLDVLSKNTVVAAAGIGGGVFTTVFSVFGIFSIFAGVLLIFLIFVMLAAERRSELGMARAIGMQRGHLVQMFVSEGMIYDLVAAALGIVLGLAISYAMIGFLGGLFNTAAQQVSSAISGSLFTFRFNVAPTSVAIAYAVGVLLTFAVVTLSSWRVSRLNIVSAIQDTPEPDEGGRGAGKLIGRVITGPLTEAAGAWLCCGAAGRPTGVLLLAAASMLLVGGLLSVSWALSATAMRTERRRRLVYSAIGLGLVLIWGLPWATLLPGRGFGLLQGDARWTILSLAVKGPALILGGILVIMFSADILLQTASRVLGSFDSRFLAVRNRGNHCKACLRRLDSVAGGRLQNGCSDFESPEGGISALTPVLKTAIAYPLTSRFRTGLAMVMFAMIITTVVLMSVVIQATQSVVAPDARSSAGYEIRTSFGLLSFFDRVTDLAGEIAGLKDFPHDQVAAVGAIVNRSLDVRQTGPGPAGPWHSLSLTGMDEPFMAQARGIYTFGQRAAGFADDAAIWQALIERDDVAIVTPYLVANPEGSYQSAAGGDSGLAATLSGLAEGADSQADAPATEGELNFRLAGFTRADPLPEVWLELRDESGGQVRTHRVQVIGVLADITTVSMNSVHVNSRAIAAVAGADVRPDTFFIKVAEGADARSVAQAVERAFLSSALDATVIADSAAQGQALTRGILQLFQGFLALGLLVGIAALGVISARSVVERRQQVGMLRAIGYQPEMVALSFVLEASFIALVGIGLGVGAGILLGQAIIGQLFSFITAGRALPVPWGQIGIIVLAAYLFSLLTTILPAVQAARIYPADALRYE